MDLTILYIYYILTHFDINYYAVLITVIIGLLDWYYNYNKLKSKYKSINIECIVFSIMHHLFMSALFTGVFWFKTCPYIHVFTIIFFTLGYMLRFGYNENCYMTRLTDHYCQTNTNISSDSLFWNDEIPFIPIDIRNRLMLVVLFDLIYIKLFYKK